jgi:hypothetical protein
MFVQYKKIMSHPIIVIAIFQVSTQLKKSVETWKNQNNSHCDMFLLLFSINRRQQQPQRFLLGRAHIP